MRHSPRLRSAFPLSLAAVAVTVALIAGCGRENSPTAPGTSSSASRGSVEAVATALRPDIAATIEVQNRVTPNLLSRVGVIGSGTSVDESGRPVIVVYTDRPGVTSSERSTV